MPSIFNSLHIGYSGLSVAQQGIDTTGHNIANAESEGYTRQRLVSVAATPITMLPGQVGNGAEVQTIKRVFDNFVFDRYNDMSADKEFSDFEKKTLEELSTYFPEIDGIGIKADLQEYYNMWQSLSDNPDNSAIKLALAKQAETLSTHITSTQNQILAMQSQINDQLGVNINEVNSLAEELAELNLAIDTAESGDGYPANDLRDRRNIIELSLSRLIGAEVNAGQLESNIQIDSSSNTRTGSYTLNVNGFNIVDGNTYHPLRIDKESNQYGFYEISYERQDGTLIPMAESITNGKIGSILSLRGASIDTTSDMPTDGIIQNVVSEFDAFAKGLIEATNNLYAQSSTTTMQSNPLELSGVNPLLSSSVNINEGSFNLIVYDLNGNEIATREITIDVLTTMEGVAGSNSIEAKINVNIDDNGDLNANNDIDDYLDFNFVTNADGKSVVDLRIKPTAESQGYTFSLSDVLKDDDFSSGTNFAGALGMSRFFDGENARDISLNHSFQTNPTLISAGYSASAGDNRVALDMVQQQFESYDFDVGRIEYNSTMYGMFDLIATEVGTETNRAILRNDTVSALFSSTEMEYASVSKVSIDEEMTNLIRYQTSYGAAAKVITTIDQMMQTLLGIKQ
ncbi:MAG: flagellar hook-associated protein FlgK [Sulfurimonas sp.]|nr:flagellar hook-associated protein FlgK [Sulfurimonas sp.]